jgi:hypothetical protein
VHLALNEILTNISLLGSHDLCKTACLVISGGCQNLCFGRVLANSLLELVLSDEVDELLTEIGELDGLLTTLLIVKHKFEEPMLHECEAN